MIDISASQLNTFLQCSRKWFWIYRKKLKTVTSLSQIVGLVVHIMQETCLVMKFVEKLPVPESKSPDFESMVRAFFDVKIRQGYQPTRKEYAKAEANILNTDLSSQLRKSVKKAVLNLLEEDTFKTTLECCKAWRDGIFPHLEPYNDERGIGIEVWREMKIPKLDIKVRGILDVIEGKEFLGSTPAYRDLKVLGKTPNNLAESEQYIFYSALAHSKLKRFPTIIQDTVVKLKKPKVLTLSDKSYEPLTITHNQDDMQVLFNRLKLFKDSVTDIKFTYPVAPHGSWYCSNDYCGFHDLCKSEKLIYSNG
jgi:hypothetical protein